MNTEISPHKEFKEEFPVYLNEHIYIDNVFFKNIYQSRFLLLWNLEYRYVRGDGISFYIEKDTSNFSMDSVINVKRIKIKLHDNSEIICKNVTTTEDKVKFKNSNNTPKSFVTSYHIEADFNKTIKLKNINTIEFYIDIEEKEVIQTLHADFKYKFKIEPMFVWWVSNY